MNRQKVNVWKHICSKIQIAMQFCNLISHYIMHLTIHYAIEYCIFESYSQYILICKMKMKSSIQFEKVIKIKVENLFFECLY